MSHKIKVFLGGYVNFLNAQNINCRALSEHLNKDKFRVSTMLVPKSWANAYDFVPVEGVKYIQQYRPMRLFHWIGWFRGIIRADVAYLPKGELDEFCRFIARLFRTRVFTTVEGLISETDLSKLPVNKRRAYVEHFAKYEPNLYSITEFLVKDVVNRRGYHFAPEILYLGVDSKRFINPNKKVNDLKNIVFIGNKLPTKNIYDFIEASTLYPDLIFHIIGDHLLTDCTIQDYILSNHLKNVIFHGRLDHEHMSKVLETMDLMFFPSRSEGFPKVHLEAACAGVSTLCYSDYGADEWITTGKDGFVVDTKEEAFAVIADLKTHSEKLKSLSQNAVELGKRFDWSLLVKNWEYVIEKIYNEE